MLDARLMEILRCPSCAPDHRDGQLDLVKDAWLVCRECSRKYPIRQGIPVMLVEVGDKWLNTPADDLPVPPPADA
jgi:uncharacterized protein YbaR (Trm112 family)